MEVASADSLSIIITYRQASSKRISVCTNIINIGPELSKLFTYVTRVRFGVQAKYVIEIIKRYICVFSIQFLVVYRPMYFMSYFSLQCFIMQHPTFGINFLNNLMNPINVCLFHFLAHPAHATLILPSITIFFPLQTKNLPFPQIALPYIHEQTIHCADFMDFQFLARPCNFIAIL